MAPLLHPTRCLKQATLAFVVGPRTSAVSALGRLPRPPPKPKPRRGRPPLREVPVVPSAEEAGEGAPSRTAEGGEHSPTVDGPSCSEQGAATAMVSLGNVPGAPSSAESAMLPSTTCMCLHVSLVCLHVSYAVCLHLWLNIWLLFSFSCRSRGRRQQQF